MILVRDQPPLPAWDDRRWAEVAGYAACLVQESLALFTLRRAEVVAMLRATPAAHWARTGAHEDYGTLSLLVVVRGLVAHEESTARSSRRSAARPRRRDDDAISCALIPPR